jgi:pSer/pThr/pTyr-binding forkhead associated (FHA) protein
VKKSEFDEETFVGHRDVDAHGGLHVVVVAAKGVRAQALPRLGDLKIGRASGSQIRIDDASISRFHAILHLKGSAVTIEDLGSANGTRVAGKRVKPGKEVPVAVGETIRLGSVTLLIQPVSAAAK